MNPIAEELVEARVNTERLGENWRGAIVMLIEHHEHRNGYMASRKAIHTLMDRYAARYFPSRELQQEDRRFVIRMLRERYQQRWSKRFATLMRTSTETAISGSKLGSPLPK